MDNNNNNMMTKKKTTQGRKKIEIKKIDSLSNRQVTFSKRRIGIFKKASELCILTGSEIGILVLSHGKRVFVCDVSSRGYVINRYVSGSSSMSELETVHVYANNLEHKQQYERVAKLLEAEKQRKEIIEELKAVNGGTHWWDDPIDNIGLGELETFNSSMEVLLKNILKRADDLSLLNSASSSTTSPLIDVNSTVACPINCDDFFLNQPSDQYCNSLVPYGSDFGNGQV